MDGKSKRVEPPAKMALAATNDYEPAVAILRRTVDADRGNARLLRNQIDNMEESWLAYKDKMVRPRIGSRHTTWVRRKHVESSEQQRKSYI